MNGMEKLKAALKQYRLGFDIWGLALFLAIMVPNFIWFAVPAPRDILRQPSVTPIADGIASVCQVVMVAALCLLKNKESHKLKKSPLLLLCLFFCLLYYGCWCFYYGGIVHNMILLGLTLFPCLAFLLYAVDRKNFIALVPTSLFTICHLLYTTLNFLI